MSFLRSGPSAIVATWFCLFIGASPVIVFTFGNFMRALSPEFGWSRALMSSAFAGGALAAAVMAPIIGHLLDRYGLRRVTLPGLVIAAIAVAAQALNNGNPALLFVLQALVGGLTVVLTALPFSKAISSWYDERRGMALGLSTIGAAIGFAIVPQFAQFLIGNYGWRTAYLGLGAAILVIAFIPAFFLLHDSGRRNVNQEASGLPAVGVTVQEGRRSWRLWAICAIFLFGAAGTAGLVGQMVPLLTDRGFSVQAATSVLSFFAISNVISRVAGGFLLDRIFAPVLAACTLFASGIGVILLAQSGSYEWVVVAVTLCGIAIGLEADLLPFLVSRYFGTRAFGELVGYAFLSFTLGTGTVGPLLMGNSSTFLGSYTPALYACAGCLFLGSIVLLFLGPYPFPATKASAPERNDVKTPVAAPAQ